MESDSGSSSDSETEELQSRVYELEEKLRESPYDYEGHVELIGLLRQQGDLDRARDARQSMSKLFPLTEELWLEWLGDEVQLCGLKYEDIVHTQQLFEAAIQDYLSINVWLQYTQFAVDKLTVVPDGLAFPREVFERAIVACGLHVAQSSLIWDAYVGLETAILQSFQDSDAEEVTEVSTKELMDAQREKLQKLCRRRLCVPHVGMEEALQEYRSAFPEAAITEDTIPGYSRAKKKLEDYLPLENSLLVSEPPPLDSYRSYLEHLISSKDDPFLINVLYQRAVAHHCLNTQLWRDYLKFLDSHFSTAGSILIPGYRQAVRNCPWEAGFWLGLVRGMERNNVPHQEIVDIFEKSVVDTFSVAEDYLALWTAYADYFRRRATGDSELGEVTGTDCENRREELLELFRRARTKMKTDYGIDGDPKDVLSRYHANMVTNVTEGRSIWDNVMTRHGREAQYWLDFIAYVRSRQKSEKCRKFYQQAVNSVTDDPRHVCEAYLQYEREEGSLESYEAAVKRTRAQLDRIKDREDTAAERGSQRKEQTWWNIKEPSRKPRQGRRDDKEQQQQQTKKKQWSKEGAGRGQSGGKREQRGDSKGKSGDRRDTQRKRKAAVLEHEDDDDGGDDKEARKVLKASDRGGDTAPVTEQKEVGSGVVAMDTSATTMDQEGPQPVGKKEERTVFVSNLAAAVTEQHLKEHFKECGDLVEVRLVHSKRGLNRINTFAYLEFMDPPAVWKALNLDHSTIIDRPIYVSPFKEKGDKPGGRPTRSYDNSCTVYVNNLQRDATEDALLQLFKQCGDIKEVRLVRGQNDRPKGYAYVEYLEKASALEAVNKLDSHQLGFKKIGVAMSAPRKTVESQSPEDGGGAKKDNEDKKAGQDGSGFLRPLFAPRRALQESTDAPVPRRSKTNLMLVPRVLSKGGKEAAEDKGREASKGKLSNDDFRKLFSSSKQV